MGDYDDDDCGLVTSGRRRGYLSKAYIHSTVAMIAEQIGNTDVSKKKRVGNVLKLIRYLAKHEDLTTANKKITIVLGVNSNDPTDLAVWVKLNVKGPPSQNLAGGNTAYLVHFAALNDVGQIRFAVPESKNFSRVAVHNGEAVDGDLMATHAIHQFGDYFMSQPNLAISPQLPLGNITAAGGAGIGLGAGYPGTPGNLSPFQLAGNNYYHI